MSRALDNLALDSPRPPRSPSPLSLTCTPALLPTWRDPLPVARSILHSPGEDSFGYENASERWLPIHTVEARPRHRPAATAPPPPPPRTPHLAPAPSPTSRAEALLVSLLLSRWQSILISTISMLASPNLDSPANLDAAVRARPAWRRAPAPKPSRPDPASAPPLRAPPRDRAPPPRPLTSPRALALRPRPAQKEMRETPDIFKKKARPARCCPAPTPPTPRTPPPVLTAPCHPAPLAASAPSRLRPGPPQAEGWVRGAGAACARLLHSARLPHALPGWKVRAPKPGGHVMM